MAQITINDDYRYKGMYRNYSASLDSNIDWEPVTENADSNKYVQINNVKFYNSAVLIINDECYFFIVSEQPGYFRFKYTWATSTYSYEITRSSGNGLYGATADNFYTTTISGVLIYYNENRSYSNNRCNVVGLPVFTSPSEYVSYISQAVQPPYNWQSVPSISGKNGILQSLVQIKDSALNDGEPVSEATVLSFDSLGNINIPSVIDEQMPVDPSDVTSVTATYLIPALENGTYEGIKLLVKKGSIPTSEEDADKVVNLDEPTSILRIDSKSVGNLDEDSRYFFVVKLIDELGTEATSDPKDIWTSHSEGYNFDYTGEIQTFTAPKTGIYQLETWGAQGGDATDGTNSARGGYGAYAVGEVFLTEGEKLYINVGGQNGYGGGGNYTPPNE